MQRQLNLWLLAVRFVVLALIVLTAVSRVKADDDHDVIFTSIDPPGAIFTEALDINSRGQIVGRFYDGSICDLANLCALFDGHNHGFLLSDGEFTTIDPPGSITTGATGINSRGDIVGQYFTAGGENHGFLLSGGGFNTIDFPGSIRTTGRGINPAGDIAGRYLSPDGSSHGFLLSGGAFSSIDFPGAFGTASHTFAAMNASGDIVSEYCAAGPCTLRDNGNIHTFLLSGAAFASFDFPDSVATLAIGINARGDIVGLYKDRPTINCTISPTCTRAHGFLRTRRERQ